MMTATSHATNNLLVETQQLAFTTLEERTTNSGKYYLFDGHSSAEEGQPIQPRYIASAYSVNSLIHGAALISATYTVTAGFDPVVATVLNPNAAATAEPALASERWLPDRLVSVQSITGTYDSGRAQQIVVDLGQFQATSDQVGGGTNSKRRYAPTLSL